MRCNTADYEWTFGKKPRGNGQWMFQAKRLGEAPVFHTCWGSFGEAKRAAARFYKAQGFREFNVCT